jgi:type IV pilus assembly protein PilC
MPVYKYLVKDKNGQTLAGSIEGQSETETVAALHKKEFIVLKVEAVKTAAQRNVSGGKVKSEDLVIFSRQLATMIDAGIPVVQALSILSEQVETRAFRDMVEAIARDIRAGTSLSDAIAKYPAVFSELFVNMTKAGEASGMLDEVSLTGWLHIWRNPWRWRGRSNQALSIRRSWLLWPWR